ncbi:MAG: hypothetical protein GX625_08410 [Clostridiaceae bacterium]|jgi:hypothetical protein|nr:hypothetical protein [Clostridiaceae bacterium]
MKKRQIKKEQKKILLQAFHAVLETCLVADDPLSKLEEIKTQGEQHFKELRLNVPPALFNEMMTQIEPIVIELRPNR